METDVANQNDSLELLYHVKRAIIDFAQDKSGATQTTDIFGTFTDLAAAKAAARSALPSEGYLKDDFVEYEENDGTKEWKHGDGVIVFAKAAAGQEFVVRLDTTPNAPHFKGNASGEVEGHLHYVLQTTIYYNNDSIGGIQTTEVEGTYPTRKAAREAAKNTLLNEDVTKEWFAEYEEKDLERDEWPYGDDVLIHAVAETGENFKISVKAQPHSHQHHERKHHGKKSDLPQNEE
ncbi:hypothetical protein VE00_08302 [Pseudogymnoascus sp. WSF 3629]|nr:hypothetical protein VE00_08302 [Pseudogymnoascus sp. WSF 3629]